jgi:hypothetical protein
MWIRIIRVVAKRGFGAITWDCRIPRIPIVIVISKPTSASHLCCVMSCKCQRKLHI